MTEGAVPDDGRRGARGSAWRSTWGLRVFADAGFLRLAVGLFLLIALVYRVVQVSAWLSAPQWGYDFSAYWLAARHLLAGEAVYTPLQLAGPFAPQGQFLYLYPPFLAVLVIPLAWLSPETYGPAMAAWAALGTLIAAAAVVAVARAEGLPGGRPGRLLLLAAAFAFPPLVGELVLGNVHALLLGLLAVAWLGVRRGDRSGAMIAGGAVGVATLVKLFPAVLLLWLLFTGRPRAAVWGVATVAILALLTVPVTGLGAWLDYPRVLLDLAPPVDATDALAPTVWLTAIMPAALARLLVVGAGLVAVAWTARRLDAAASFGIAVAVSVLIAPALFQHYLALMVLPLLLGLRGALVGPLAARLGFGLSYLAMWPGQQPLLGSAAWLLNRAIPTLGALGVPLSLARWGGRRPAATAQES